MNEEGHSFQSFNSPKKQRSVSKKQKKTRKRSSSGSNDSKEMQYISPNFKPLISIKDMMEESINSLPDMNTKEINELG